MYRSRAFHCIFTLDSTYTHPTIWLWLHDPVYNVISYIEYIWRTIISIYLKFGSRVNTSVERLILSLLSSPWGIPPSSNSSLVGSLQFTLTLFNVTPSTPEPYPSIHPPESTSLNLTPHFRLVFNQTHLRGLGNMAITKRPLIGKYPLRIMFFFGNFFC